ncbi:hypothetical protein K491DRAFT_703938 [Lophiostoma macrostomum CBS 122681]|uniref:Nuclear pore assembly and biogenesis-domain-containing protein n=1 Tax=Lophiostoma macrostomum CBS 122681 TaxID=1314788 RepID=A0A6A6T9M0_9PLEO|nr:hypothetical protein K491DRAFT_703938 [Lophiostoma macrostomum CBS 122681]
MDFVQDYLPLLNNLLPPSLLSTLISLTTTTFGVFKTIQTNLTPLLQRLTTQPDLTSILVLVIILFASFKILDMAYRAVMFWINLVFKLVFWGGLTVLGYWVWHRGVDGFMEDVQGLVEHWTGSYEKYSGEVKKFQRQKERELKMKQAGYGRRWR